VDDDSEWYVVDDAKCPGLGLVELNPEPKVVPIEVTLESTHQSAASPQKAESAQAFGRRTVITAGCRDEQVSTSREDADGKSCSRGYMREQAIDVPSAYVLGCGRTHLRTSPDFDCMPSTPAPTRTAGGAAETPMRRDAGGSV
jgi:hypothetical protein